MPLIVSILVLKRTSSDLEQSHGHSWTNFRKLDALIPSSDKDMMPDLNTVLDVFERHNPVANLLIRRSSLTWREQMLQYLFCSLAQFGVEVFEDKMWVRFANRTPACIWEVVPKHYIVQRE